MRAVDTIRTKRDGLPLSAEQIDHFVRGAVDQTDNLSGWASYQISALLMAIVLRGMDADETADLTRSMVASGTRLDWSEFPFVADKHSTGGVGDKTSLVIAPLAAACGVVVPMLSGRGLGHTGGTLDKLEAIPGFRVHLSLAEIRATAAKVGCVMCSPTDEIAPADRVLYALRDVTATVESIPLISASIMSKKIAEGIRGLVMDVKCGSGAFMKTPEAAFSLARSLVRIGAANGVHTRALLTRMDHPLGRCVGNALEIRESIDILQDGGPDDVTQLCLELTAQVVHLSGATTTTDEARRQVEAARASGAGLRKLHEMIVAQGGDPRVIDDPLRLPSAPGRELLRAQHGGYFAGWEAGALGHACVILGAGRSRVDQGIDPGVGAVIHALPGQPVRAGDPLLEIHYRDPAHLSAALARLSGAGPVLADPIEARPLLLEVID